MEKRRDGMGGTRTTAVQGIDVELQLRVAAAVFQQCINFIVNSDMEFDWAAAAAAATLAAQHKHGVMQQAGTCGCKLQMR